MRYIILSMLCLSGCPAFAGQFRRSSHEAMVARTGIVPNRIGTHEGVGRSSTSFEHAMSIACYANSGMRVVSVQKSMVGGMYNVIVQYRK